MDLFVFSVLPVLDSIYARVQVFEVLGLCHVTGPQNHVLQLAAVSLLKPGQSLYLVLVPQLHKARFITGNSKK